MLLERLQSDQLGCTAVAFGRFETIFAGNEALVDVGGGVEDNLLRGVEWEELFLVHTTGWEKLVIASVRDGERI